MPDSDVSAAFVPVPPGLAGDAPFPQDVAAAVINRVLRRDLQQPGFALLDLGRDWQPRPFRAALLRLASALDQELRRTRGWQLRTVWLDRFDQQRTTAAHRDGGPDETLLLLGYEPTEVASRLFLVDLGRAASAAGLTPRELLKRHNPMAARGQDLLAPYRTEAEPFDPTSYRVVVVNNGVTTPDDCGTCTLGVLHEAAVPHPLPDRSRVVNSIMLEVRPGTESWPAPPAEVLAAFVEEGRAVAV